MTGLRRIYPTRGYTTPHSGRVATLRRGVSPSSVAQPDTGLARGERPVGPRHAAVARAGLCSSHRRLADDLTTTERLAHGATTAETLSSATSDGSTAGPAGYYDNASRQTDHPPQPAVRQQERQEKIAAAGMAGTQFELLTGMITADIDAAARRRASLLRAGSTGEARAAQAVVREAGALPGPLARLGNLVARLAAHGSDFLALEAGSLSRTMGRLGALAGRIEARASRFLVNQASAISRPLARLGAFTGLLAAPLMGAWQGMRSAADVTQSDSGALVGAVTGFLKETDDSLVAASAGVVAGAVTLPGVTASPIVAATASIVAGSAYDQTAMDNAFDAYVDNTIAPALTTGIEFPGRAQRAIRSTFQGLVTRVDGALRQIGDRLASTLAGVRL